MRNRSTTVAAMVVVLVDAVAASAMAAARWSARAASATARSPYLAPSTPQRARRLRRARRDPLVPTARTVSTARTVPLARTVPTGRRWSRRGFDGLDGVDGSDGQDGADGRDGAAGPSARSSCGSAGSRPRRRASTRSRGVGGDAGTLDSTRARKDSPHATPSSSEPTSRRRCPAPWTLLDSTSASSARPGDRDARLHASQERRQHRADLLRWTSPRRTRARAPTPSRSTPPTRSRCVIAAGASSTDAAVSLDPFKFVRAVAA